MSFHTVGQLEWMTMQLATPEGQQLVQNVETATPAQVSAAKVTDLKANVVKYGLPIAGAALVGLLLLKK